MERWSETSARLHVPPGPTKAGGSEGEQRARRGCGCERRIRAMSKDWKDVIRETGERLQQREASRLLSRATAAYCHGGIRPRRSTGIPAASAWSNDSSHRLLTIRGEGGGCARLLLILLLNVVARLRKLHPLSFLLLAIEAIESQAA